MENVMTDVGERTLSKLTVKALRCSEMALTLTPGSIEGM